MKRLALTVLLSLTACTVAFEEGEAPEPVVVLDPPREVTTTAPPADGSFHVDILTDPVPARGGMDALGTFTLEYDAELNCLYHVEEDNNGEPGTGGRVVIQWPFGHTASLQNGKVIVFDDTGKAVTTAGVQFQIGGGGGEFDGSGIPGGCDAIGIWYANGDPIPPG